MFFIGTTQRIVCVTDRIIKQLQINLS